MKEYIVWCSLEMTKVRKYTAYEHVVTESLYAQLGWTNAIISTYYKDYTTMASILSQPTTHSTCSIRSHVHCLHGTLLFLNRNSQSFRDHISQWTDYAYLCSNASCVQSDHASVSSTVVLALRLLCHGKRV